MAVLADRFNKSTAATYLGVSERVLDLWRAKNTGPRSFKVAGRLYWLKNDLDEWVTAQIVETARGGIR